MSMPESSGETPGQDLGETLLVLCTCPDAATARKLAEAAVKQSLAACVNELPGVISTYVWDKQVQRDEEILLLAKTTAAAYAGLETLWREQHPYELPEIIAVPIANGLTPYLNWVGQCVSS